MENSSGEGGASLNERIESLAMWVGTSVAAAFFSSLERCSCVNLSTSDSDDENEEEAKDRPLMFASANGDSAHCVSVDKLPV